MSLQGNISNLVTRIATEFKKVYARQGDVANLATADKTSIVAALNELNGYAKSLISDANLTGTATTLSAAKVAQLISTAKSEIIGGAGSAYDTLMEIQTILGNNENNVTALMNAVANRVRFDAAQTLTAAQKTQALANIGGISASDVGDVNTDFVAAFNAALA